MLLGFRTVRGKPLIIMGGDVGCRKCLVAEERKASALLPKKKKSKCLVAEEKKKASALLPREKKSK